MKKTMTIVLAVLMLTAVMSGMSLAAENDTAPLPLYYPVTGKVASVDQYFDAEEKPVDGWYFVWLDLEDEGECVLLLNDTTCYPYENQIAEGDTVTGWYRTDMPMLMIYPPRYSIEVLVAGIPDTDSVKVDRFASDQDGPEGYLVSKDQTLAIMLGADTEVMTPDGKPSEEELDGRDLAVVYDVSTRSIPARTTPKAVYVLPEHEELMISTDLPLFDVENLPILVNGETIEAPKAFMDGEIVMLPLRAIAEALGYTVAWDGQARMVKLNDEITLTIGNANCKGADKEILLASAPVIVNDRTFVPIHFFRDAAGVNSAYVFEGQIIIDREGEKME